jgi:hypothetical protein
MKVEIREGTRDHLQEPLEPLDAGGLLSGGSVVHETRGKEFIEDFQSPAIESLLVEATCEQLVVMDGHT